MDVELIQKINTLALDLMKQGLAQDREDAVQQAERMLKRKNVDDGYVELRERVAEIQKPGESVTVVDLSQNQIRTILEQNTQFLVKTIKEFKEKIASLEKDLSDLRNKFAYSKLPTVNDIVSAKKRTDEPEIEDAVEVPPPSNNSNKTSVPVNHPRVGKWGENDVSIEKFFYMGGKK